MNIRNLKLQIPNELYRANRMKLVDRFRQKGITTGAVLLQGAKLLPLHDTDMEMDFKQDDYFTYLFGFDYDGAYGLIRLSDGFTTLFVPQLPESYAVWMGPLHPPAFYQEKYGSDACEYIGEISATIQGYLGADESAKLYLLDGVNADSGLRPKPVEFEGLDALDAAKVDKELLYPELSECRVFKTEEEMKVYRYVISHSSDAMKKIMKTCQVGCREFDFEAIYKYHMLREAGCRYTSFSPICASGPRSSTLHYFQNDGVVEDGQMVVCDMGADCSGFSSDITIAFPANGKFTEDQAAVYETVLKANRTVMQNLKPGIVYMDMHMLAVRILLEGLRDRVGVLQGDTEDMLRDGMAYCFQPHGLGHMLGLTVHDVGGYNGVERSTVLGPNKLRTPRELKEGMLLTVEPGIYFIKALLDQYRADPKTAGYFTDRIDAFADFGGVRIEDDVYITATGAECLSDLPRTVAEIEAHMASE